MTRFEEACKSPQMMAISIGFCIAAYVEQMGIVKFKHDELVEFIAKNSESIEKWLMDEAEV